MACFKQFSCFFESGGGNFAYLYHTLVIMRKLSLFLTVSLLGVVSCSKEFDDSQIWDKLNDHESRIDYLETLCDQMNTNIKALQTT